MIKTTALHVRHALSTFLSRLLHDYDMKPPIRTWTYDDEFSFLPSFRLSLKELKFIFLATFSLPSTSSLLKVPISQQGLTGYFAQNAQHPQCNLFARAKNTFTDLNCFFFSALALLSKCKSLTLPIRHNLVPRAFRLKNGWGGKRLAFSCPTHFLWEKPWGRGCIRHLLSGLPKTIFPIY